MREALSRHGNLEASPAMTNIDDWPFTERVVRFKEIVEIVDQIHQNEVSSDVSLKNGLFELSDRPGLGIDFMEAELEEQRVEI